VDLPHDPRTLRRWALGVALFALAFAFLALQLPERLYGDDVFLVRCLVRDKSYPPHLLYLPLARAAARAGLALGLDPFASLRLLAALGFAGGTALTFAAARRAGAPSTVAVGTALLLFAAPGTQFFGSAAEVHGPHLLAVAGLALALAGMRAGSGPVRVLVTGLALAVVIGTHKSGVLLLPATVVAYVVATPGRGRAERLRDLLAGALALVVALCVGALIRRLEVSEPTEPALRYIEGIRERFAAGFGPLDWLAFSGEAWVAHGFTAAVAGSFAVGVLVRTRPRAGLVALATLAPYGLFFPLFGFPERGAYYLVLVPVLAAALAFAPATGRTGGTRPVPVLGSLVLVIALLGGLARPGELLGACPSAALMLLPAAAFAAGWLARALPFGSDLRGPVLLALAAASLVGARRELAHYDAAQPRLVAARAACELTSTATGGVWITSSFEDRWLFHLLYKPWNAPWTDRWAFARELPTPRPQPFVIGDPAATPETFAELVRQQLAAGKVVLLADDVTDHVARNPGHAPWLEALERAFRLAPPGRDDLPARRVLPR
jgi:hypothetical protein